MDTWLQVAMIAGLILVAVFAIYLFLTVYFPKMKGYYCRNKMGVQCRRLARRGGHIYMRDLVLPTEGKPVRIDHMVIGTFGVVLCNCYDYKGELYGSRGDQHWYIYNKEKQRKVIANPVTRMDTAIAAMRTIFAKESVYHVTSVDAFVVFGNGVKMNATRDAKDPVDVLLRKKASAPLHREKYTYEGKVDAEKAAKALDKHRVK